MGEDNIRLLLECIKFMFIGLPLLLGICSYI